MQCEIAHLGNSYTVPGSYGYRGHRFPKGADPQLIELDAAQIETGMRSQQISKFSSAQHEDNSKFITSGFVTIGDFYLLYYNNKLHLNF